MRRLFEVRGLPARAIVGGAAHGCSSRSRAGLRFQQVPTLPGADATALAVRRHDVWAATPRGVWQLDAGAWTLDGLSGQTDLVARGRRRRLRGRRRRRCGSAVARPTERGAPKTLPARAHASLALSRRTARACGPRASASRRRAAGTWTALASPGGLVTARRPSGPATSSSACAATSRGTRAPRSRSSRRACPSPRTCRRSRPWRHPLGGDGPDALLVERRDVDRRSPASALTTSARSRAPAASCARRRRTRAS